MQSTNLFNQINAAAQNSENLQKDRVNPTTTTVPSTETRTEESVLLDNSISYKELTVALRKYPEASLVAEIELKRKAIETREEKRRAILGENYVESKEMKEMDRKYRRPRWNQLGKTSDSRLIARMEMDGGDYCEAFSNGYAHYCNRGRHAIMWIPEYLSESYTYFHLIGEKEKQYLTETETVEADMLDDIAWYFTLMMHGEDVIASNLVRARNSSNTKDDEDGIGEEEKIFKQSKSSNIYAHIPTPEDAYMKKAEMEAQLNALNDNERKAVLLRHECAMTQTEIAEAMNCDQSTVCWYLKKAKEKMAEARRAFNEAE